MTFTEYCKSVSKIPLNKIQLEIIQRIEDAYNNNRVLIIGGRMNGRTQLIKWWRDYHKQFLQNSNSKKFQKQKRRLSMQDFINFFDDISHDYPMHLEIHYSKTVDWCVMIYKKNCGEDGKDLIIFQEQDCDISFLMAKAQVKLKEHLIEANGGY